MSTHLFRLASLPLALAVASGFAAPAGARDEVRAGGLEEVVVTAQRRETSLQDTPIAITAFTERKLEELGVFDVSQVADFAPNVSIQKQPSSNSNMGVSIRGVGIGETSLLADPKVGFYLDGVFMSKTVGAVFDVADLERIEILRGPQGTLFGRNSTGGAINVTTKKPTGRLGGKAEATCAPAAAKIAAPATKRNEPLAVAARAASRAGGGRISGRPDMHGCTTPAGAWMRGSGRTHSQRMRAITSPVRPGVTNAGEWRSTRR